MEKLITAACEQRIKDAASCSLVEIIESLGVSLTRKGNGRYMTCCTFHDEKTPSLSINEARGIWKCFGCGRGGDAIAFVMEHRQCTYHDALEYIAGVKHIALDYCEETPEELERRHKAERKRAITDHIQAYMTNALWSVTAEAHRHVNYISDRIGNDLDILRALGFGMLTDKDALKAYLREKDYSDDDIASIGLFEGNKGIGTRNTLAIPVYVGSRIATWHFRYIDTPEEFRFRWSEHASKADAWRRKQGDSDADTMEEWLRSKYLKFDNGHNNAFGYIPNKVNGDLVIVEGIMDVMAARYYGIENVCMMATEHPHPDQIVDAIGRGCKRFIMLNDTDATDTNATKNTDRTKRNIDTVIGTFQKQSHPEDFRLLIAKLPTDCPSAKADPCQYIHDNGIEAFKQVICGAYLHWEWLAGDAVMAIPANANANYMDGVFWSEVHAIGKLCTRSQLAELKDYIERIEEPLHIGRETIDARFAEVSERQAKRMACEELAAAVADAGALLADGRLSEAQERINATSTNLERSNEIDTAMRRFACSTNAADRLQAITDLQDAIDTGMKVTPYKDGKPIYEGQFSIAIPTAQLTIIAGQTGHGKTTLLLQMFLNMAMLHPDKIYYFLTCEMSPASIDRRAMAAYTKIDSHTMAGLLRDRSVTDYLQKPEYANTAKLYADIIRMMDEGRINVVDACGMTDTMLCQAVRKLANTNRHIGAIFVDYVQCMTHDQRDGKTYNRSEELGKVCESFDALAIQTGIPVIMSAQYNRQVTDPTQMALVNIGESTHIEQKTNFGIGVWNCSAKIAKTADYKEINDLTGGAITEAQKPIDKMFIEILKNREGEAGLCGLLEWHKHSGTIETIHNTEATPKRPDEPDGLDYCLY